MDTGGWELRKWKCIGKNVTIYPSAKIINSPNISLGDEVVIDDFCFLYGVGDGIEIGSFCHVTVGSILQAGGLLKMGDFSAVAHRCTVLAGTDDYHGDGFIGLKVLNKYRKTEFSPVTIGRHAHIRTGTIILPGVTIGEGCAVGAGSLVLKDLPAWTICWGSPCKAHRIRPSEKLLKMEDAFLKEYYG